MMNKLIELKNRIIDVMIANSAPASSEETSNVEEVVEEGAEPELVKEKGKEGEEEAPKEEKTEKEK